jgi:phosphinothricin acetyltransferase
VIRGATTADGAAVAAVYAPYVLESVVSFEEQPPNGDEMAERIAGGHLWLVAELAGQVVGFAYGGPHRSRPAYRWSVEVSVYLAAHATGRGLGRALYGELLPLLGRLGYVSAYAGITLPNAASVGLHEAMGFTPVGVFKDVGFKHGAWHDVGWWWLGLQQQPPAQPAPPRGWQGELDGGLSTGEV